MAAQGCLSEVRGTKVICLGTCTKRVVGHLIANPKSVRRVKVNGGGGGSSSGPMPIPGTQGELEKVFPSDFPLGYPSQADDKFNPCRGPMKAPKPTKSKVRSQVIQPRVEVNNFFLPLSHLSMSDQGEGVPHPCEGIYRMSPKKGPKKGPKKVSKPLFTREDFPTLPPPTTAPAKSTSPTTTPTCTTAPTSTTAPTTTTTPTATTVTNITTTAPPHTRDEVLCDMLSGEVPITFLSEEVLFPPPLTAPSLSTTPPTSPILSEGQHLYSNIFVNTMFKTRAYHGVKGLTTKPGVIAHVPMPGAPIPLLNPEPIDHRRRTQWPKAIGLPGGSPTPPTPTRVPTEVSRWSTKHPDDDVNHEELDATKRPATPPAQLSESESSSWTDMSTAPSYNPSSAPSSVTSGRPAPKRARRDLGLEFRSPAKQDLSGARLRVVERLTTPKSKGSQQPEDPSTPPVAQSTEEDPRESSSDCMPLPDHPVGPPLPLQPVSFIGKFDYVLFLGVEHQEVWSLPHLINYYFQTPAGATLIVRADKTTPDVPVRMVLGNCFQRWASMGLRFQNPLITFRSTEVPEGAMLFLQYPQDGTTFIVTDGDLPAEYFPHSGKLYHCNTCQTGYSSLVQFKKHISRKHKKKTGSINPIFIENLRSTSLGRPDIDQKGTIFGLPVGHHVGGRVAPPPPQAAPSPSPSNVELGTPVKNPSKRRELPTVQKSLFKPVQQVTQSVSIEPEAEVSIGAGPSRKSTRKKGSAPIYRQPTLTDEEDLSSEESSGSGSQGNQGTQSPDSSDEKVAPKKRVPQEKPVSNLDKMNPTDDEESGDESGRKVNKSAVRLKMRAAFDEVYNTTLKWSPTDEDNELIKKHIAGRVMQNSSLYKRKKGEMPYQAVEMIELGEEPTGSEYSKYISKTWSLYRSALFRLLGMIQENRMANDPETLPDGHLHLRQFFALRKAEQIIPMDIEQLLSQFQSPSIRGHAFEGYMALLKAVRKHTSSIEGARAYKIPITDEEISWKKEKMLEKGHKKQINYEREITELIATHKLYKPHSQFHGDRVGESDIFKKARKELEGKEVPDPMVVVPLFLNHEESLLTERKILEAAENGTIVTDAEFNSMVQYLIIRIMCKMGNRPDMLAGMTWVDFWTAVSKGFGAYPFAKLDGNARQTGEDGDGDYLRKDPYAADPSDPDDMFCNNATEGSDEDGVWQATRGIVVQIAFHKTGASYMGYIFLNAIDTMFLKAWEVICNNKLGAHANSQIFVKANGKPFASKKAVVNISIFCLRTGITNHTAYVFRYMYVGVIYNARSALLREAEQFALQHSQSTAAREYMGDTHKMLLAIQANGFYRMHVMRQEEMVTIQGDGMTVFNTAQGKRQAAALAQADQLTKDRAFELQKRKDDAFKPYYRSNKTKSGGGDFQKVIIGDSQKVALLEMVLEGHNSGVSNTSPLELLTNKSLQNYRSLSLLLRTFHSLPRESPSVLTLENNLLDFCRMQEITEGDNICREVEVAWGNRLLNVLHNIHREKNAPANIRVLNTFFNISKSEGGSYNYFCGNAMLQNIMVHWHTTAATKAANRERVLTVVKPTVAAEEFRQQMAIQVEKLKESAQHTPTKAVGTPAEVFEADIAMPVDTTVEVSVTTTPKGLKIIATRETPAKGTRSTIPWDDKRKMRLLDHYLRYTDDPFCAKSTAGRKTAIENQVDLIKDRVAYDDEDLAWKQLAKVQTMANFLYKNGFKSQLEGVNKSKDTGLLAAALEFCPDPTVPLDVDIVDEIMDQVEANYL